MGKIISKIFENALNSPNKIALFDGDNSITYLELIKLIEEKSEFLKMNDINSLAITNVSNLDWILYDLACLQLNILTLPIPNFFTPEQSENAIKQSGIRFILSKNGIEKIKNTPAEFDGRTQKITFTSGSTGTPKGVCLSKENIENIVLSISNTLKDEDIKVHSSILPYPILLENLAGLYFALYNGCSVDYSATKLNGESIYNKLNNSNANSAILVPEILKMLTIYMQKAGKKLPNNTFFAVGGSKVSEDSLIQAKALGLNLFQGYGLSENCSVATLNNRKNNKIGSVGKPLEHLSYYIADDGELIIKNPQFLGYSEDDTTYKEYPTGDIAKVDEDGFLYITGRKKNLIITSMGRNISPEWPESILLKSELILQTLVYGDAESKIKALIVPVKELTKAELLTLKEYVNSKLPKYAQISELNIVDNFEKNNLLTSNMRPKRQEILNFYNLNK